MYVSGFPDLLLNIANMFLIHVQWPRPPFISGCFRDILEMDQGNKMQESHGILLLQSFLATFKLQRICGSRTFGYFWWSLENSKPPEVFVVLSTPPAAEEIWCQPPASARARDIDPWAEIMRRSWHAWIWTRTTAAGLQDGKKNDHWNSKFERHVTWSYMIQLWRITPHFSQKKGGNLGIYHTISYIIILYASSEKPYIIDMMSWVRTIALKPFVRFMLSWNLGMSWLSIGYRECGWFHNKKYRNPRGWWSCLAAERQRLPWWPWARNSPAGNWKPYFGMDGSCPNGDSSTFWLVKNMFFSQNWEVWWPEASSSRMGCCTTCPSSCEGISCCLERNTRVTWKFLSTEWRDQLDRNILYIYIYIYSSLLKI